MDNTIPWEHEIPKHRKKKTKGHVVIEYKTKDEHTSTPLMFAWGKNWTKHKAYKRQEDADRALKQLRQNSRWFDYRLRPGEEVEG